ARAQHFEGGNAGEAFAGTVPNHHAAVGVDHESRHHQMLKQPRGIVIGLVAAFPGFGGIARHQATAATSSEGETKSLRTSALGLAPANTKPCIWVQHSARNNSFCCAVSTPSATVVMLQLAAIFTTACTMTEEPSASVISVMKAWTTLLFSEVKCL